MAASTITRDTLTNDTGSASAPNGDGTSLNNNFLQNNIYARIDAMLAGSGSYTYLTLGGGMKVAQGSGYKIDGGAGLYSIKDLGNIADNGTASLTLATAHQHAFLFVSVAGTAFNLGAMFYCRGTSDAVLTIYDGGGNFSATATTAGKVNVYWSAGNSRYEIENKSGTTLAVNVFVMEAQI